MVKACEAYPSWEAEIGQEGTFPTQRRTFLPWNKGLVHPHAHTANQWDVSSLGWRAMIENHTTCTLTEE